MPEIAAMIVSRKQLLVSLIFIVAVGLGSLAAGRLHGARQAERMRARLEIRWPDMMAMPEQTRAQIVKAAFACDLLHESAPTPGSVEACVREGAAIAGQRMPPIKETDP